MMEYDNRSSFGKSHHDVALRSGCCSDSPLQVAVIGDFRRNDFQNVIRDIREKTAAIYFDNLTLFLQANRLGQSYDLIFLLASSFSQYFSSDIQRLRDRWPIARIVMIAGSLAEGERRTGMLPPDMIRYYWHQWETEVLPLFASFCDRQYSPWGLPPTASDEERLLVTAAATEKLRQQSIKSTPQIALIVAEDPAMQNLLWDWMEQKGFKTIACQISDDQVPFKTRDVAEILFDVISENFTETLAIIQLLKSRRPLSTRLTVFYNSPRPDEIQQLTQAGADRVVSKPFFS
jgi:CheY-like chemotaxis protein